MTRFQSKKHERIVDFIARETNGVKTDNHHLQKGKHYPDIILPSEDIEVEMFYTSNLKRKCKNYEKSRKRTLIIAIPDEIKAFFDEIILFEA